MSGKLNSAFPQPFLRHACSPHRQTEPPFTPMRPTLEKQFLSNPAGTAFARGTAATTISLLAAAGSQGAIVFTDVSASDLTILTDSASGQSIYFDLDHAGSGPHAGLAAVDSYDFRIYGGSNFSTPSAEKPSISPVAGGVLSTASPADKHAVKLGPGATIGVGDNWFTGGDSFLEQLDSYAWQGTNGVGYVGLRLPQGGSDYLYGWALLDYRDLTDQLTLKSFALETDLNRSILAGNTVSAVPEPDHAVALSALLAGSALLRSRRRVARVETAHD